MTSKVKTHDELKAELDRMELFSDRLKKRIKHVKERINLEI